VTVPRHAFEGPELAIVDAVPGDDNPHRRVRIALLAALHAGQNTEIELATFAEWLAFALEDPPHSLFWYGPLAATELAARLENLARELHKAARAIDAAKPQWTIQTDSIPEGNDVVVGLRSDRQESPDDHDREVPF
jgi:hypothetical protein